MLHLLLALFIHQAFALSDFQCSTTYDDLNIPHVETRSTEEFYYCFGLNHGRDRAWMMDYFRRVGQGRNAEVLGFSQLKSDLMMRLLDLPEEAQRLWLDLPDENKKYLSLYAEGVNEGFKTGKSSQEFIEMGIEPEPWLPEHSLLILLLQSFDQTRKTFTKDYEESLLITKKGSRAQDLFDEDHMPWENTILKDGEYPKNHSFAKTTSVVPSSFSVWGEFPTVFGLESGSNNWVVSKTKSKTGKAILANDPHLDLKTPLFWYWINIKSPDFKALGGSVPGVPVIPTGTNGKVSWGLTNSYMNSADAILVDDIKDQDVISFRPVVWIKFGPIKVPFFFKSFEKLTSGHRVLPLEIETNDKIVLRWSGFRLNSKEIVPMFNLPFVKNVSAMDELLKEVGLPSWNFVFADNNGDIGYRMVGKTFRHAEKLPFGMNRMSVKNLNEEDYLSPDERPHVLKPKRNYVYSANNRHWPKDAKFYGGRGYSFSFRGFRIDELLQGLHDYESFKLIQCDGQVVDARFFLSKLQNYLKASEFENWSLLASDESKQLPLYRRLLDLLMEKWEVNEYALFKLLDNLNAKEIRELKEVFQLAKVQVQGRTWGEILRLNFLHLSKNQDWVFSPELPGVGDTHSVNPGTAKWNSELNRYEQYSGASMRMIIEMDKTPKIWLALPGVNRNYDKKNQVSAWKEWKSCLYREVAF